MEDEDIHFVISEEVPETRVTMEAEFEPNFTPIKVMLRVPLGPAFELLNELRLLSSKVQQLEWLITSLSPVEIIIFILFFLVWITRHCNSDSEIHDVLGHFVSPSKMRAERIDIKDGLNCTETLKRSRLRAFAT